MKNIKLYIISLLLYSPLFGMDNPTMLPTIFAPAPLLELHKKNNNDFNYISSLKKVTIPVACCFCYGIKKNSILLDIRENPYTTSILTYLIIHYCTYLALQNQQAKMDKDIIDMMQHIFHLLIIGHGMYNKITTLDSQYKISAFMNTSTITTLQLFLHKAYNTWFVLFSYYQEHYKNKPLYAYQTDQIDLFEVLQASSHEIEILPMITKFYDKNNTIYDYEPILNCLEIKLKLINHKLINFLPTVSS